MPRWLTPVGLGLAVIGLAVVTFVGLGHAFGNGDEVIYAEAVRELGRGHDLSAMHWQGYAVLERPVAPFVLAALGAALAPGELGLRLASAVASLATLLVVYLAAARSFGRKDAALAAAILCAGAPSFHVFSRALLSDPPFVLALTVALAGLCEAARRPRGLVIAAAGLGTAVALKSLAVLPIAVVLGPWWLVRARRIGTRRVVLASVGLFVALAAPFYVVGLLRYGDRFVADHLARSLVARARGALTIGMSGGRLSYLRYLVDFDGPAAIWILGAPLVGLALGLARKDRLLAWVSGHALASLVALSLIGVHLPHYLLPLYPAAAIALAGVLATGARALAARPGGPRPELASGLGLALAVALALAGLARTAPAAQFLPSDEAPELGRAAAALPADTELWLLDWYAPAVAYYADRPLHIAASSAPLYDAVSHVRYFAATGVASHVPPPVRPGQPLAVAGPIAAIEAARWLVIDAEVARAGDYALVRAHLVR